MKKIASIFFSLIFILLFYACSEQKVSKGDKFFADKNFEQAVVEYSEELKYQPNDVRILYHRGRSYEELKNYEGAKADFDQALQLDPNNFQVLLSLANLHHKEKNFTNALLVANRAAEIPGAPAMASFMKGRALHQLGKTDEALKAYGGAIYLDKDFGQAYFNRGLLKVGLKNIKGACEDFQLSSALEYPGSKEAYEKYCK